MPHKKQPRRTRPLKTPPGIKKQKLSPTRKRHVKKVRKAIGER